MQTNSTGERTPVGSPSGLTVTIVEHPKGFLMRLEHDGASMTLDRAEAFDLHEKLSAKLGGMPVKLPEPTAKQSKCLHAKWRAMKHPPRSCIECGLLMWDAGD